MAALAFFSLIILLLSFTSGHFSDRHVLALSTGQTLYALAMLLRPEPPLQGAQRDDTVALLLLICSVLLAQDSHLLYSAPGTALEVLWGLLRALPVLAVIALGLRRFAGAPPARYLLGAVIAGILAILVVTRLLVLGASPTPHIDVFTSSMRGVDYLLHLQNPYTGTYQDIYQGQYDYPPGFAYWPGYLLWAGGWGALFRGVHDVRLSLILAELGTAACLVQLLRRRGVGGAPAAGIAALWLASPVALFIVEQAWIDPLTLLGFAAAMLALDAGRTTLGGALLGATLSTKQYAFMGVGFFLISIWRGVPRAAARRATLACAAAFAALMLPFILAAPRAFYRSTIGVTLDLLPRTDSLNLMAYVARIPGPLSEGVLRALYRPASIAGFILWGLLVGYALRRRRGCGRRDALIFTGVCYGLLFMIAKQAFCNYYYFLSFFVLATALIPDDRKDSLHDKTE